MAETKKKSIWKRWYMIVLYCFVGLIIIGAFLPDASIPENTEDDAQDLTTNQNTPSSLNNYQSCIKDIFKSECQKQGLLYTDYSSAVGFITCTDDGSYTLDDIGDDSAYLQVYTPTRILQKRCGTYQEPTNSRIKCQEDYFESQCVKKGLIYTDWRSAVGFIT